MGSHVTTQAASQQPYSLLIVKTASSSQLDLNYIPQLQPLVTTRPSTCTTSQILSSSTIPEKQQLTYNGPFQYDLYMGKFCQKIQGQD